MICFVTTSHEKRATTTAMPFSGSPAPSLKLLRFLRSQSDAICFFTANPRTVLHTHEIHLQEASGCRQASHTSSSVRGLRTTSRRAATVEASILNLDFLLPRASSTSGGGRPLTAGLSKRCGLQPLFGVEGHHSRNARRALSESNPWRQGILNLGKKANKRKETAKLEDLRPLTSLLGDGADSSMMSLGRTGSNKTANELKLRCTEFDENGKVTLVNGEFKKSELIAKVHIPSWAVEGAEMGINPLIYGNHVVRPFTTRSSQD